MASLAVDPQPSGSAGDFDLRFQPAFGSGREERIQIAHLDAAGSWIGHFVGEAGSATAALLPARELVAQALQVQAAGWLLAHNHPSGDLAPSCADLQLTRRVQALGRLLGIRLVDHLIYASGRRLSFREEGLL